MLEIEGKLNDLESEWIDRLNTMVPNGYNLRKNAAGQSGWKHSDEARGNMRKSHLGVKLSTEHAGSISRALKGKSNHWLGKKRSLEDRLKLSSSLCGKNTKLSYEQAEAIRTDSRPHRVIASEYGVSTGVISHIKCGLTYRKVSSVA